MAKKAKPATNGFGMRLKQVTKVRFGKGQTVEVLSTGARGKVMVADNIKGKYNVRLDDGARGVFTNDQLKRVKFT